MNKRLWVLVLVGALGYFVDIYDLVLFGMLRVRSLQDLGVPPERLLDDGVLLLNCQMAGLLLGGILWGVIGDRKGRLSVLFGSILMYSLANIANSYVASVSNYAIFRFIAGIGLAGELGAAITLVSETLPKEIRGYGTAIVAAVGLSGAIFAGLTTPLMPWRQAYLVGGGLGLLLLILRIGVMESTLFMHAKTANVARGDFSMLFRSKARFIKYVSCIVIGIPIWYVAGILMTFSPEITRELGIVGEVTAGNSIMYSYIGVAVGDLFSGFMSQWVKSRKKVVTYSMVAVGVLAVVILSLPGVTAFTFYALCICIGFATGYWAVFVTIAAEQFGTNLRSTVATSVPNFVRGSVVLLTLLFRELSNHMTLVRSAEIVGILTVVIGLLALRQLEETHGKDLNYFEAM